MDKNNVFSHGRTRLDGLFAALSGTDANDLLHGGHKDLAIPNAASLGCSHNRFNDHVFQVVRDDYFYLGFGEKVNDIFGTPIEFGMAALPTEATHFTDGHPLDARGVELFLDLVQLKGFDDRFDLLHDSFSSRVSLYCPHPAMQSKYHAIPSIRAHVDQYFP